MGTRSMIAIQNPYSKQFAQSTATGTGIWNTTALFFKSITATALRSTT